MKKYIGKIMVAVLTLAVIAGAFYACLRIANDKSQARDNVFSANLKAVTYTVDSVDKSNAKLVKEMAKWQATVAKANELSKTAEANANSALETVAATDKKVAGLESAVDSLKEADSSLNEKTDGIDKRLSAVEEKLSKPALTTKPVVVAKKAKPVVKRAPAKVAVKKPAVKKPVKKAVVKKIAAKKPVKVVKAKSVKLDAGVKTVITVGPNKGGQMEVTLDIFK